LIWPWTGVSSARDQAVGLTAADQLLEQACQAKATGNQGAAFALLHRIVRIAPDNLLARWQLGQVKVDNDWLSIEESQRRAEADPRQAQYLERKEIMGESPQAQLALARWCRGNKLEDEAQFHFSSVLSADPNNKEALRAAHLRWHEGELKTVAQIRQTKQESSEVKKETRQWALLVAGWVRALAGKNDRAALSVLDEIRAVDDVAAIPAFEEVTIKGPQAANETTRQ